MPTWSRTSVTAVLVGVLAAAVKLVYSFLPLANLLDVLVFGFLGATVGRGDGNTPAARAMWVSVPAVVLCGYFVGRLGLTNVLGGVGTGWLLSIVLIPGAALTGAHLARQRAEGPRAA